MLLTVEKGIKDGICHTIHRYTTTNNKYMKSYNKDEESSYLIYWDVNNLYVWWATSQKLPADSFERVKNTSQFNESCMKNYDEDSDKGYILGEDVGYPKNVCENDLPFLLEKMKIKKCQKLLRNIYDKRNSVIHTLKQALKHGLMLKKVRKAWLKPYFDVNTKLRTKAKTILKKTLLS